MPDLFSNPTFGLEPGGSYDRSVGEEMLRGQLQIPAGNEQTPSQRMQLQGAQAQAVSDAVPRTDPVFARNSAWALPGQHNFNTDLGAQEPQFQTWVKENKVPFDILAPVSDYDMRGFWKALQAKHPMAATAVNSNDKQMHYPDFWKTPYHESFSAESQWANPNVAPRWNALDQLVLPNGDIIFDEKARKVEKTVQKNEENKKTLSKVLPEENK